MKCTLISVTSLSYFGCLFFSFKDGINCTPKGPFLSVQWRFSEALRPLSAIVIKLLICMRTTCMTFCLCSSHEDWGLLPISLLLVLWDLDNICYRLISAGLGGLMMQISRESWLFWKKHTWTFKPYGLHIYWQKYNFFSWLSMTQFGFFIFWSCTGKWRKRGIIRWTNLIAKAK